MTMRYAGAAGSKDHKKMLLWGLAATAALLVAAALAAGLFWSFSGGRSLLAGLPRPPEGSPFVALETEGDGLPLRALAFLAEDAALPADKTPVSTLLPVIVGARRAALLLTERETGVVLYGVVQLDRAGRRTLSSGALPDAWASAFVAPELVPGKREGAFEIRAENLPAPLYVELEGRRAYLAETPADAEEIHGVRSGDVPGMRSKWGLERRWAGHILLSDGGALAAMADEGSLSPAALEVAWRAAGEGDRGDEIRWRLLGLEKRAGKSLARNLKPHDWSKETPLVPDRPLLSVGINMPDPGRDMANLPGWLGFLAGTLERIGLRDSETSALLTGPMTLSLGGRTQILWFELPGLVLDVPGRGKLAYRVLDAFWSQLFMGAEPKQLDGFTHGGSTELPFSVIAAANGEKMIVALADPDMTRSEEVCAMIARETKAIGWLFADLPMIGASLEEMSSVNTLLSADDDAPPLDDNSAGRMREALEKLGRLFVVWETPTGGRAAWYE